jgi:hypothetical protein
MSQLNSILIDYDIIKNSKIKYITPEKEKHITACILIISDKILKKLESLPPGKKRLSYIDKKEFNDNIKSYCFIFYDPDNKYCEVSKPNDKYIDIILKCVMLYIPNDVNIVIKDIEEKQLKYYNNLNFKIRKKNNKFILKKINYDYIDNTYGYDLKNFRVSLTSKKTNCILKLKFSEKTIKYLKTMPISGTTLNENKTLSQKEISGEFFINKKKNSNIYIIDINHKNLKKGQEQETEILHSSYNFHLHPKEAYVDNKVLLGWPSSQDYLTFLLSTFSYGTVFHAVVSLEGVYIISLNNNSIELEKDLKDFIEDKYNIDQGMKKDNQQYLKRVNNIKYKKQPIFTVQFLNWKSVDKTFSVYFKKDDGECKVKLR